MIRAETLILRRQPCLTMAKVQVTEITWQNMVKSMGFWDQVRAAFHIAE